jgi:hypothetical protein
MAFKGNYTKHVSAVHDACAATDVEPSEAATEVTDGVESVAAVAVVVAAPVAKVSVKAVTVAQLTALEAFVKRVKGKECTSAILLGNSVVAALWKEAKTMQVSKGSKGRK